MTNSSTITDLNKAIESYNPFDRSLVVRSHDVWQQNFPDVPSINSHISDALFQGIEQIRSGQRSVLGMTIKAEKGLGKSHLISRIRHRLKNESGSFFVYMSEVDYGDLNQINSQFLNTLALSLKQVGSQGVMQWQELAAALVNTVFKSDTPTQQIINRFPGVFARDPKVIEKITGRLCQLKPDIKDPYVVQAILWTLSAERGIFAINWLAGKELTQVQADAMGLPIAREEDREARSLSIASQILDLVGDYRSIVICFDEVEPKGCNAQGLTTPQVVSLLAKDLYSKIKRGILMVAVFPRTWAHQIQAMPFAESVTDRIGEKIFDLKYLNSDDVVSLVSYWLKDFYDQRGLTPHSSVYPFEEKELRDLGREKPIVRRVLQWCYENWKAPGSESQQQVLDPLHQVELAFNEQLSALDKKIDDYFENSNLLAEALRLGFITLLDETVGQVKIDRIEDVQVKSADRGYLHFRIVGKDNGKLTKIVVSVLQDSGSKFVSAALKRLIEYDQFDMTRGCLVRSKAVKAGTKGANHLDTLLSKELGGEWVLLKAEDIKPLLALLFVYKSCQEYEITEEQVIQFIQQGQIVRSNYLIGEILSDPSGQIPNDVVDEDSLVVESTSNSDTSINSIDDLLVSLTP
jgi:hypothetical protein